MSTQDTNAATPSVLDDVQKRLDKAWSKYDEAVGQRNANAQARAAQPDTPGTTYEDFLKGSMPEKPTTVVDPQKEQARAWITNIGDAINAVGGIVGAASGANVVPMTPLSGVNQQRFNKLLERRKSEQDSYNRAVMQAQSHAMSTAEAYRRRRQQLDSQAAALDDARVAQAKVAVDKAQDDYNRAYRQDRDTTSDAQRDRQENRLVSQHQDDVTYRNAQGVRADRDDIERHNKDELAQWYELPGGRYVRKANYMSFINSIYADLMKDENIAKELKAQNTQIEASARINPDAADKAKESVVKRYLSSTDADKRKAANDAAERSGLYGTPNLWSHSNIDTPATQSQGGKKTIPGF